MYRCRAITPPLYNTKRKNGYPIFCSAAFFGCHKNYVPYFPDTRVCRPRKCSASADRENTAKTAMPKTFFGCLRQQIFQQPVMTEWVWGNARREKRRDLFLKDFLSEQSVGNRFLLFCLFIRQKTAKRDKKTVCFTNSLQSTYHKWQKKYTAGAKAPACQLVEKAFSTSCLRFSELLEVLKNDWFQ